MIFLRKNHFLQKATLQALSTTSLNRKGNTQRICVLITMPKGGIRHSQRCPLGSSWTTWDKKQRWFVPNGTRDHHSISPEARVKQLDSASYLRSWREVELLLRQDNVLFSRKRRPLNLWNSWRARFAQKGSCTGVAPVASSWSTLGGVVRPGRKDKTEFRWYTDR